VTSRKGALPSDDELLERLTWGPEDERARIVGAIVGWFAEDRARASARVGAMLQRVRGLRSGAPLRAKGAFACIVALAEGLGPGEPLPPECDLALTFHEDAAVVRSLLQRVPPPRRAAMFEAWLAEGSWSRYLVPYLDLAPSAATAILEQAQAKGELREVLAWEGFAKRRGTIPALDAVLARFDAALGAEPPPPPPPPPRIGSFRFVDPVRVLPGDFDGLDPVARSQYLQIAGSYVESGEVTGPRDFVRQLNKEELDEGDAELRRWKVLRGDEHVHDLWVVWVENALFFRAGTEERSGVSVIQGRYLAERDEPALVELAEDLAASERESLWALPPAKKSAKAPAKKSAKAPAKKSAKAPAKK
jgi:hypothetical protein